MTNYRPVLYHSQLSGDCSRVKRTLCELSVEVEERNVLLSRRHRRELKELSGSAQVPCLVIAEAVVQDAEEIIKYLHLRYGDGL